MSFRHNVERSAAARRHARWQLLLATVLVAGLACAMVATALHPAPTNEPQGPTRLLAEDRGAIQTWILFLGSPMFVETQADLVARSHSDITFRVCYADEGLRRTFTNALSRRGSRHEARVVWERMATALPSWPRDYYLAGSDVRGVAVYYLHHPQHYVHMRRGPTQGWRGALAPVLRLAGSRSIETCVRIDGGDVVASAERAFVSDGSIELARTDDGRSPLEVIQHLEAIWGLPVTVMRTAANEPSPHCDVYMMPVGERRMIVGSPRLALALLQGATRAERAAFAGEIRRVASRADPGDPVLRLGQRDVVSLLERENARAAHLQRYEVIVTQLTELGYRCFEVPLLLLDAQRHGSPLVLSYANVIQDRREGRPTVYMPTYRLGPLDAAAKRTWRRLGFRVVTVDALGAALYGGALHCLSQVVRDPTTIGSDGS